jgi:hypothetical protein
VRFVGGPASIGVAAPATAPDVAAGVVSAAELAFFVAFAGLAFAG